MHAAFVAYFAGLSAKHPESAELYRALPYIIEFSALCWCAYTFFVRSVRDQFRALSDMSVRDAPVPQPIANESEVDEEGRFQMANGDWHQVTYDKRGRVNGSERCQPPNEEGPTVITQRGSYRLGRLS